MLGVVNVAVVAWIGVVAAFLFLSEGLLGFSGVAWLKYFFAFLFLPKGAVDPSGDSFSGGVYSEALLFSSVVVACSAQKQKDCETGLFAVRL